MRRLNLILFTLCAGLAVCTANSPLDDKFDRLSDKIIRIEHMNQALRDRIDSLAVQFESIVKRNYAQEALLAEYQQSDWTTIQRRQDGSVDFYRNWTEYKTGFGDAPHGEFFVGLQKLHELTSQKPHELLIVLKDWDNDTRYAIYDTFVIGSEQEQYSLKDLGEYRGNAGDALEYYKGSKFSTLDVDNDEDENTNCAKLFKGGWWFKSCCLSDLNGPYLTENYNIEDGVTWYDWRGLNYSLKFAEMKIRSKKNLKKNQ
uniref:Fibrinogen C-terminal domain-containing protein n=1 Tax=Stomoxys calcitrans TaxID=35570 RepID=A0A1I8PEH7_STOCA